MVFFSVYGMFRCFDYVGCIDIFIDKTYHLFLIIYNLYVITYKLELFVNN